AVETAAFALHEHREVGGRGDFGRGVLQRLPSFGLYDPGELALGGTKQHRRAAENLAALRRRQTAPSVGGARGRIDRLAHVRVRAARDLRDYGVVHRTTLLERRPVRRGYFRVVDPVKNRLRVHAARTGRRTTTANENRGGGTARRRA